MKWRVFAVVIAATIGLATALVLTLLFGGRSESQVQAPERSVQWPALLSDLPAPVTDMAVDSNGILWFLALTPASGEESQPTNALVSYDPSTALVEETTLPSDDVSPFIARIEVGSGRREGKVLVAWESTLLEVDSVTEAIKRIDVPLDPRKIETGSEPPTTLIYDIAVDQEGTVWVSRDHYPYLIAINADGSSDEFALPEEAGSPERLAVDGGGQI
ncbi:MAG: hypothetical protein WBD55_08490, partial [Dehalococcoidia bacterium]